MLADWNPQKGDVAGLEKAIDAGLEQYRKDYKAYYEAFAEPDSPGLRDQNPTVVLIPSVGMVSFWTRGYRKLLCGSVREQAAERRLPC